MSEKLLNCPFCGGAADYAESTDTVDGQEFRIYLAGCPNHCAQTWQGDPDSAAAAWNTRTPDLTAVREKLEAIRDAALDRARDRLFDIYGVAVSYERTVEDAKNDQTYFLATAALSLLEAK